MRLVDGKAGYSRFATFLNVIPLRLFCNQLAQYIMQNATGFEVTDFITGVDSALHLK